MKRTKGMQLFVAAVVFMFSAAFVTACGPDVTEEMLQEMEALEQEVSSLEQQAAQLKQEKQQLQDEIAKINKELEECEQVRQETQANLKKMDAK
ncbi:MAG: hypothetical protein GF419_04955 [Ignavibacteriales bacterium]|jgi:septal ring factor EnvC (AmiA/AmiB activator)|nr:hypothetical protein [Ignavibacteriales bacterium]